MQTGYVLRDLASPHYRVPVQDTSDEALIELIAEGDKRAMQVLYARHNVRVYRFIVRLTGNQSLAEDLVSEVFLDVWRQAEGFEAKSQVSTWLLAIARYKALSALRRRSRIPPTIPRPWSTPGIATPSSRSAWGSSLRRIAKSSTSSTITRNRSTKSRKSSGCRPPPSRPACSMRGARWPTSSSRPE